MGQIIRYAEAGSLIRVPADLPDAARWVLDFLLDSTYWGEGDMDALDRQTVRALRRLRPIRRYASGFIRADGVELSLVRNALDTETFQGGCEEYADNLGVPPPPDSKMCMWCGFCKALTLRDRIDFWMDAAGVSRSVYLDPIAYDVEGAWRVVASQEMYPAETVDEAA